MIKQFIAPLLIVTNVIFAGAYAQEARLQPDVIKKEIWFFGEESYKEKVATFKFTAQDVKRIVSRKRLDVFIHQDIIYGHLRRHWFVVDDFYVLSDIRRNKKDYPLQGIYVNGNTGEVWYRFTDDVVSPDQFPNKWLREPLNLEQEKDAVNDAAIN